MRGEERRGEDMGRGEERRGGERRGEERRERERERERERQTDRQTDRQTETETDSRWWVCHLSYTGSLVSSTMYEGYHRFFFWFES